MIWGEMKSVRKQTTYAGDENGNENISHLVLTICLPHETIRSQADEHKEEIQMTLHDCLSIFLLGEIFTATVYFFIATLSEKNY